jgi:DNA-binding response OmpR family regulator
VVTPAPKNKRRLLIIDDNAVFLKELRDSLEANGFDVVALSDAQRAAGIASMITPDAVLMDLKMPKKSGFEVTKEFNDKPELAKIPIIAMSAEYKNGKVGLLNVHGIHQFLKKPFSLEEVIEKVEQSILEKKSSNVDVNQRSDKSYKPEKPI